jgi:hypothetical protein
MKLAVLSRAFFALGGNTLAAPPNGELVQAIFGFGLRDHRTLNRFSFPEGKALPFPRRRGFSRSEDRCQGWRSHRRAKRAGLPLTRSAAEATAAGIPRGIVLLYQSRCDQSSLSELRSTGSIRTLSGVREAGLPIRGQALGGPLATREDRTSTPRRRNSSASI